MQRTSQNNINLIIATNKLKQTNRIRETIQSNIRLKKKTIKISFKADK